MSDKNLRLQVLLSAVDKITRPFKSMQASNKALAASVKATKDQLKQLDTQAGKIDGFRKTKTQVAAAAQALSTAREKARALAVALKSTDGPTAKQARQFQKAREEAAKLQQKFADLRLSLQNQRTALQNSGVATNRLGEAQRSLRSNITGVTGALSAQQKRLDQQARQQKRLNAARHQFDESNQRKVMAAGVGYTSMATGRAMGRGLVDALHVGYDFDAMMSKTQAVTRIPTKADPQMQSLRHQARTLPLSSKFTDLQVAEGQYFLGRTGYSPQQVIKAMPGMLNLAAAGDIDLGTTADIASNIQTAMGIPADKMDRVADVLTALFTRNNVDIPMLGESLKYSAGVGREYGQSLETVSAATAIMGNAGIQGSQAGTAMRAILSRIGNSATVKKLGVTTKDKDGNMRDLVDILQDIDKKTSKMGNVDRGKIFKDIAGMYAVTGFGELMRAASDGKLQQMRGAPGEYDGEARRVSSTMLDNLKGDMTLLLAALENISVELFEKNDGWLRKTAEGISNFLHGVAEFLKEHPKVSAAIVKIGAAAAILTTVVGTLAIAVVGLLGPFALLRFSTRKLGIRLLPNLSLSMLKFASTTPITKKQVVGFSKKLLDAGKNALTFSKQLLGGAGRAVVSFASSPLQTATKGIKGIGRVFAWLAKSPLRFLRFALGGLGSMFGILVSPLGLITAAVVGAGLLIYKYWKPIKAFLGGVVDGFKTAAAPIKDAFAPLMPVFTWIGDKVKALWGWFTDLLTPVKSTKKDLDSAASAGKKFGEFLAAGIELALTPLKLLIESIKWVLGKLDEVKTKSEKTRILAQTNPAVADAARRAGVVLTPGPQGNSVAAIRHRYTGEHDGGGRIPLGKFGVVGEYGPEIVNGPANVTSRKNTAAMAAVAALFMGGPATATNAPLHPYSLPGSQYPRGATTSHHQGSATYIDIHAPIQIIAQAHHTPQDIAREVARQLDARERQARSRANSSFNDIE
jgi:TP901 family phage tail tape measure protein